MGKMNSHRQDTRVAEQPVEPAVGPVAAEEAAAAGEHSDRMEPDSGEIEGRCQLGETEEGQGGTMGLEERRRLRVEEWGEEREERLRGRKHRSQRTERE